MKIELSIIIVNYNGLKFLNDCLNALTNNLLDVEYEIILLDNNSSDKSCEFILKNFPNVILIPSKINLGFGKGNNEAVNIAKGEHLLLINNDTIVLNPLKPVLDFLKKDNEIGVLGINMVDKNKKYLPAAGVFPNFKNMFLMKKLLKINQEFKTGKFLKKSYEVDWLTGSFLMLSKENFNKINGFDEDYFLYVEDVDFCKKISKIGKKRVFLSDVNYIHFVGFNNSKNPMLVKGYTIYIHKHFTGIEKKMMLLVLSINSLVKNIKLVFKS